MAHSLMQHDWPGNIRELKNVIERAVYHAEDEHEPISVLEIDPFDSPFRPRPKIQKTGEAPVPSPAPSQQDSKPLDYSQAVATLEQALLKNALESNKYNQRDTARFLNLTYHQLRHQLKKHGLL